MALLQVTRHSVGGLRPAALRAGAFRLMAARAPQFTDEQIAAMSKFDSGLAERARMARDHGVAMEWRDLEQVDCDVPLGRVYEGMHQKLATPAGKQQIMSKNPDQESNWQAWKAGFMSRFGMNKKK
eukprot:gnl/TRDRNA2_/TRDRNA2_180282_c0_seq1.p2 gnl/TRDRNA2_/TRDRNA2_180282_c0~~gnl/TRDRNA2_/TRDRNA2_180282_c0_seq1.p2  ORF type:complete len:126 (+),score=28.35 gnl/TRDRNA2_/TRDRNA2_180282_c0_seq1:85-462(+)